MSKKVWLFLAIAIAGLAACNKNSGGSVVITPTPIPTASSATITATYQATPLPNLPINMFKASSSASATAAPNGTPVPLPSPVGTPIATQTTDANGQTTFNNLTPGTTYCWTYVYMPVGSNATIHAQLCTDGWYVTVPLGS